MLADPVKTWYTFMWWIPTLSSTMPLWWSSHIAQWTQNSTAWSWPGGWFSGWWWGPAVMPPSEPTQSQESVPSTSDSGLWSVCNGTELQQAHCFARQYDITTINDFEQAEAQWLLIRSHLAKMMVNFSVNVLGKTGSVASQCIDVYDDITDVSDELRGYIQLACSMNIMWLESDGDTPLVSFRPEDVVTRVEFATVLSRVLYGNRYDIGNDTTRQWYEWHLTVLNANGLMNNIHGDRPYRIEQRGFTWITLQRTSKKQQ